MVASQIQLPNQKIRHIFSYEKRRAKMVENEDFSRIFVGYFLLLRWFCPSLLRHQVAQKKQVVKIFLRKWNEKHPGISNASKTPGFTRLKILVIDKILPQLSFLVYPHHLQVFEPISFPVLFRISARHPHGKHLRVLHQPLQWHLTSRVFILHPPVREEGSRFTQVSTSTESTVTFPKGRNQTKCHDRESFLLRYPVTHQPTAPADGL